MAAGEVGAALAHRGVEAAFEVAHETIGLRDAQRLAQRRLDAVEELVHAGLQTLVLEDDGIAHHDAHHAGVALAELQHQGFRITEKVAGIPTALMGEWGDGGPVIAFLGEYDALPGLSQEPGLAEPRQIADHGFGHGCGHNLLGSAALSAACWKATVMVAVGPLRCLATIRSASPGRTSLS